MLRLARTKIKSKLEHLLSINSSSGFAVSSLLHSVTVGFLFLTMTSDSLSSPGNEEHRKQQPGSSVAAKFVVSQLESFLKWKKNL